MKGPTGAIGQTGSMPFEDPILRKVIRDQAVKTASRLRMEYELAVVRSGSDADRISLDGHNDIMQLIALCAWFETEIKK